MHENEWLNWHVNGTWLFNQGLPLLLSPWERGFADGMISTYGRNIKGSYKVIESSRPQQKYWHFFKPESYVVEDKQRLAKDYEWNLHVLDVFFWSLTQCQMALMHDYVRRATFTTNSRSGILLNSSAFSWECIYSKLRKFTISKRGLVKCARLTLTRRAIHGFLTLQPLKCIPLVVIVNRESLATVFFIIIISFGLTRC